ncbi:hypothetical protein [Candidatus Finniella inopinata]|nr:hypothetical protein [Candidatus Finniella inopinata]
MGKEGRGLYRSNCRKLGTVLYSFLTESRSTIRNPLLEQKQKRKSLREQLESILADCETRVISKNLSLKDYLHIYLTERSIKFASYKLLSLSWPSHLRPFCLFLHTVSNLNQNRLLISSGLNSQNKILLPIQNGITLSSSWINREQSGPYLVLASALMDERKEIYFQDAFAIPVLSRDELLPVESNFERSIAKTILSVVREFQYPIEIEKPLFCLYTSEKQKYRPDFILTMAKKEKSLSRSWGAPMMITSGIKRPFRKWL